MKLVTLLLIGGFPLVASRLGTNKIQYPTKTRQTQELLTHHVTLAELRDYKISYSSDSDPKVLSPFILSLFETDGLLPLYPSLSTVEAAIEMYTTAELNAVYAPFSRVMSVQATILSQASTASSRRLSERDLQVTGSELEVQLNVTFANEPSPLVSDVEEALRVSMQNLDTLVTNITENAKDDHELQKVHSAFRLESDGSRSHNSTHGGGTGVVGSTGEQGNEGGDERQDVKIILPLVFAVCFATLVAGTLIVRRKAIIPETGSTEPGPNGVDVFWEDESDIFSFETALLESPRGVNAKGKPYPRLATLSDGSSGSKAKSRWRRVSPVQEETNSDIFAQATGHMRDVPLNSPDDKIRKRVKARKSPQVSPTSRASDVFSGISLQAAGRKDSFSLFSMFSNRTTGSRASTVVMSNKKNDSSGENNTDGALSATQPTGDKSPASPKSTTPRSRTSSLFTFSEEEEEDEFVGQRPKGLLGVLGIKDDTVMSDTSDEFRNAGYVSSDGETYDRDAEGINLVTTAKQSSEETRASTTCFESAKMSVCPSDKEPPVIPSSNTAGVSIGPLKPSSVVDTKRIIPKPVNDALPGSLDAGSPIGAMDKDDSDNMEAPDPCFPFRGFKKGAGHALVKSSPRNNEEVTKRTNVRIPSNEETKDTSFITPKAADGPNSPASTGKKVRFDAIKEEEDTTRFTKVFSDPGPLKKNKKSKIQLLWGNLPHEQPKTRRHTRSTGHDGTTNYQSEVMDPQEWSVASGEDAASYASSEVAETNPFCMVQRLKKDTEKSLRQRRKPSLITSTKTVGIPKLQPPSDGAQKRRADSSLFVSPGASTVSGLSTPNTGGNSGHKEAAANKKLISDLVWLEKKIAGTANEVVTSPASDDGGQKSKVADDSLGSSQISPRNQSGEASAAEDSLSFKSGDGNGSVDSTLDLGSPRKNGKDPSLQGLQTIVCRDCFAPPGKLKLVIHSTKDGPAIHTVKKGSSLEGHVFAGDLIISVDNVDTRSHTAEQVMKMMTARTRFERKITVLHFEDAEEL